MNISYSYIIGLLVLISLINRTIDIQQIAINGSKTNLDSLTNRVTDSLDYFDTFPNIQFADPEMFEESRQSSIID